MTFTWLLDLIVAQKDGTKPWRDGESLLSPPPSPSLPMIEQSTNWTQKSMITAVWQIARFMIALWASHSQINNVSEVMGSIIFSLANCLFGIIELNRFARWRTFNSIGGTIATTITTADTDRLHSTSLDGVVLAIHAVPLDAVSFWFVIVPWWWWWCLSIVLYVDWFVHLLDYCRQWLWGWWWWIVRNG